MGAMENGNTTERRNNAGAGRLGGWKRAGVVLAVTVLLTGGTAAAAVFSGGAHDASAQSEAGIVLGDKKVITVSGKGEFEVAPDVAYLDVAVETRAATAKEAQANNATKFAALEAVLYQKYAIGKPDVKTTGFSVHPEYKYADNQAPKVIGYVAAHNIRITYRQLDKIGTLLDALSAAGANRMNGVQFDTEREDQYELQALEKAMANADGKAAVLAKASKRTLKGVLSVSQGGATAQPVYGMVMEKMANAASDSAGGTSIQSGQITVRTDITVMYEME